MLARSALGFVLDYNHLPPKVVEQPSVSSFRAELQRLVKDREHARPRRTLACASRSEAVRFSQPPLSQGSAPQTAEPDGPAADSGPRLRRRGPFFRGSMKLSDFVTPSSAAPGGTLPESAVPVRRERMRRKNKITAESSSDALNKGSAGPRHRLLADALGLARTEQ